MATVSNHLPTWVLESPKVLTAYPPTDQPLKAGWVRVRPSLVGICGSDVHLFLGSKTARYPVRLGHEIVGRVVTSLAPGWAGGERVVVEPNIPCGRCSVCRKGLGRACPNKMILGVNQPGGLSSYVDVPGDFVFPVPAGLRDEQAVWAEPLAVTMSALRLTGNILPGSQVGVIGGGPQGLLLAWVLRHLHPVVLEHNPLRRHLLEGLGFVQVEEEVAPRSLDVVFDTGGTPQSLARALELAAPGAVVTLVGLSDDSTPVVGEQLVRNVLTIKGSIIYEHPIDFHSALRWLEQHAMERLPFVQFGMWEVEEALVASWEGKVLKAVVAMEAEGES